MTSHELARALLIVPDLPVAIHAMGHTYHSRCDKGSHGAMSIAHLHHWGGDTIVIGNYDSSEIGVVKANEYPKYIYIRDTPHDWSARP